MKSVRIQWKKKQVGSEGIESIYTDSEGLGYKITFFYIFGQKSYRWLAYHKNRLLSTQAGTVFEAKRLCNIHRANLGKVK